MNVSGHKQETSGQDCRVAVLVHALNESTLMSLIANRLSNNHVAPLYAPPTEESATPLSAAQTATRSPRADGDSQLANAYANSLLAGRDSHGLGKINVVLARPLREVRRL